MLTTRFRFTALLGLLLLLVIAGTLGKWTAPSRAHAAGENDSKLKALLKEKLAVAQEALAIVTKAHQNGDTSIEGVVEANQVVGKAQLDLCETNAERVAVLERMLAQTKNFEKSVAELVKVAAAPKTTLLKARLSRLDVEVALERAKEKQ